MNKATIFFAGCICGLAAAFLMLVLTGCGTFTPTIRRATTASYDGKDQTSGVLAVVRSPANGEPCGRIVTADFVADHARLAPKHPKWTDPNVGTPQKLDDGTYYVNSAFFVDTCLLRELEGSAVP